MKVVLDTSAIIYLSDFRKFDEILTVQEVVEEVKDRTTAMKLSTLKLKILEPSNAVIEKVRKTAKETGDLDKLSKTDLKILALALENRSTIISDDRNVQNVAEKLKLGYISIFNEKITKLIIWKKFCRNCKKFYDKKSACPVCGAKLVRLPESSREIVLKIKSIT